jgi:signal peptidase II
MRDRILWLLLICLPFVGADQFTKMQATAHLMGKPAMSFWDDTVRLQYALNPGAWGSLGSQLPDPIRKLVFTVGVGLILAVLMVYIIRTAQPLIVTIALSLVLAGGLGNLIDRALYGHVVDFMYIGFKGISWMHTNIFNVADVAIMIGGGLLLFHAFQPGARENATEKTPEKTSDKAQNLDSAPDSVQNSADEAHPA